jgi:hypothetical protein
MEKAKSSPLRFTWEYPIPDYYKPQAKSKNKPDAVVIIADQTGFVLQPEVQKKTEGLKRRKVFQNTSGVFQHQAYVTIYHK